ncbi:MAG: IS91 family transposase, partial [Candidatus Binatia bacterium]
MADVFRTYQDDFLAAYSPSGSQRRVLRNLSVCRTAALGGHVRECDHCGRREIAYNSCRDRHCPKCQAKKQADWLQARSLDLLEVPYFHVVFTLPEPLGPLTLQNQKILYDFLFRAASETLLTLARDPKHLGAKIGLIVVLHTWGQNLLHHPHLHCVVPGGGLSLDESRWVPSRQDFFLPVRILSRLFQKKFLAFLQEAYRQKQLVFQGHLKHLATAHGWFDFLQQLQQTSWVVYCKPPFGSPQQV